MQLVFIFDLLSNDVKPFKAVLCRLLLKYFKSRQHAITIQNYASCSTSCASRDIKAITCFSEKDAPEKYTFSVFVLGARRTTSSAHRTLNTDPLPHECKLTHPLSPLPPPTPVLTSATISLPPVQVPLTPQHRHTPTA